MDTEPSTESEEKERLKQGACNSGTPAIAGNTVSKYARSETVSDWIARKEQKRAKANSPINGKRTGLSSGNILKKTTLNKVSKKQNKRNKEYKTARQEHYSEEDNRKCFLCSSPNNLSVHHIEKRGSNTADKSKFVTLCLIGDYMDVKYPDSNHSHTGGCHGFIEGNKSLAREMGLLV